MIPNDRLSQDLERAVQCFRTGQSIPGEALCREILSIAPNFGEARHLLGLFAFKLGRLAEAADLLREAIVLLPQDAECRSNLGAILLEQNLPDAAIGSLQKAIALSPRYADAHNHLGNAYRKTGLRDAATAAYREAARLSPGSATIHTNLADTLQDLGRFDDAFRCYYQALALEPTYAKAHGNLGLLYYRLGRPERAIIHYQDALELKPDLHETLNNMAVALNDLRQVEEAETYYQRTLSLQPDLAEARWNRSLLLLTQKKFEQGWPEYEWRWKSADFRSPRRPFTAKQWDGSPVPDETILLHAEQGMGDTLHFMRYVPLVRERSKAKRVIVECQSALTNLLISSGGWDADIVSCTDVQGADLPPFDKHLPLLSLPLVLRLFQPTDSAIPIPPYVRADPEKRRYWRERFLSDGGKLRVGIVWAGNPYPPQRSIPIDQLSLLAGVSKVTFYSLQVPQPGEVACSPPIHSLIQLSSHLLDFREDAAAVISELDLIISVDTAAAHLAGALGKQTWTVLPFACDWRWGIEGDRTPWYPSMRLFRQKKRGNWADPLKEVAAELQALADIKCAG